MNQIKKLPLYIKLPVFLAAFLSLVLIFVTVFENVPPETEKVLQCRVKNTGELKLGQDKLPMLTHFYKDSQGQYIAAGLDLAKNNFMVGKVGFAADMTPYGELLGRQESSLRSAEKHTYEMEAAFDDWAFVKDETGKRIPLHVVNNKILAKNSLGLCTGVWGEDLSVQRVNDDYVVFWNGLGQIGFYKLKGLLDYIPKGVSRSADLMMTVEPGNTMNVGDCSHLNQNRKARVRVQEGMLGFSSGDSAALSLYEVAKDQIKLNPLQLPVRSEPFSDFILGNATVLGFRSSGWLDRSESWNLMSLDDLKNSRPTKPVETAKPVAFRSEYSLEKKESAVYWVAELRKHRLFFDKYILSKVSVDGVKQSFEVDDEMAKLSFSKKGFWVVLPGNRHLLVAPKGGQTNYTMLECNP